MKSFRSTLIGIFPVLCFLASCGCKAEMSAPAKSDLVGSWTVEYIGESPVIDKSPAYIEFTEDNRVGGNSSCNRFSGGYTLSDSMLSFSEAASTRMMCPPALMEQEMRFLSSLKKVAQARLENGLLLLQDSNGNLVFKVSRRE